MPLPEDRQQEGSKMPYPCIELTLDVVLADGRTVRMWIDGTAQQSLTRDIPMLNDLRETILVIGTHCPDDAHLIRTIQTFPNVNAVQIKRGEIGIVVYFVEFAEKG